MNIFFVHESPEEAAKSLPDKLAVKMPLETAQLLSTALNHFGGIAPYRSTHEKHPSARWVKESKANWDWLYRHGLALCETYRVRYGKTHACLSVIVEVNQLIEEMCLSPNASIEFRIWYKSPFTEPPRCMPEQYKSEPSVVDSYRKYLVSEKSHYAKWKKIAKPEWWK